MFPNVTIPGLPAIPGLAQISAALAGVVALITLIVTNVPFNDQPSASSQLSSEIRYSLGIPFIYPPADGLLQPLPDGVTQVTADSRDTVLNSGYQADYLSGTDLGLMDFGPRLDVPGATLPEGVEKATDLFPDVPAPDAVYGFSYRFECNYATGYLGVYDPEFSGTAGGDAVVASTMITEMACTNHEFTPLIIDVLEDEATRFYTDADGHLYLGTPLKSIKFSQLTDQALGPTPATPLSSR